MASKEEAKKIAVVNWCKERKEGSYEIPNCDIQCTDFEQMECNAYNAMGIIDGIETANTELIEKVEGLREKMLELAVRTDMNAEPIGCRCEQRGECIYCKRVVATNRAFNEALAKGGE